MLNADIRGSGYQVLDIRILGYQEKYRISGYPDTHIRIPG
jgi:hypothetical protein